MGMRRASFARDAKSATMPFSVRPSGRVLGASFWEVVARVVIMPFYFFISFFLIRFVCFSF